MTSPIIPTAETNPLRIAPLLMVDSVRRRRIRTQLSVAIDLPLASSLHAGQFVQPRPARPDQRWCHSLGGAVLTSPPKPRRPQPLSTRRSYSSQGTRPTVVRIVRRAP